MSSRDHKTLGRSDLIASSYTLSGSAVFQPPRFSFAERIAAAAEAGFTALGLAGEDYAAMRAGGMSNSELRRIADDHGIAVAELEFLTNWWCDDDRGRRSRELEAQFYAAADTFGARHLNVGSPASRGTLPPLEVVAERFGELCDRAARHNLLIAFEFLPWSDIPDAATAGRLIKLADRKNGGILLDTWHYFRGAADPEQVRAIPADRFFLIQFDDAAPQMAGDFMEDTTNHRRLPGQGSFDLTGFVRMLDLLGIDAPFSVEILSIEQRNRSVIDAARAAYDSSRAVIARARHS
jgi:sugar phosphate isomerase/epimerase